MDGSTSGNVSLHQRVAGLCCEYLDGVGARDEPVVTHSSPNDIFNHFADKIGGGMRYIILS